MNRMTLEQAFEETLRKRQLVDDENALEIVPTLPQITDVSEYTLQDFVEARDMISEVLDGQDIDKVMDRIENGLVIESDRGAELSSKDPRHALNVDEAKEALEAYACAADDFTRESRHLGIIEGGRHDIVGDHEPTECLQILSEAIERMEQRQQLAPIL